MRSAGNFSTDDHLIDDHLSLSMDGFSHILKKRYLIDLLLQSIKKQCESPKENLRVNVINLSSLEQIITAILFIFEENCFFSFLRQL